MKHRMLIARKSFSYANRALKSGDRFTASDKDAMILCGLGNARADDQEAEDVTEQPKTLKLSTYRRRDMQAEKH